MPSPPEARRLRESQTAVWLWAILGLPCLVGLVGCAGQVETGRLSASPDAEAPDTEMSCVGDSCETGDDCGCSGTCVFGVCEEPPACGEFVVSWNAPVEREDDTCLEDLAGFLFFYGPDSGGPYTEVLDVGLPCIDGVATECGPDGETKNELLCAYRGSLGDGIWYMALKSYTETGQESALSAEVMQDLRCP